MAKRSKAPLVAVIVVIIMAVALAVLYYFTQRTPDNTYQVAIEQVESLEQNVKAINTELAITSPIAAIDNATLDNLNDHFADFKRSANFSSSIITKNSSLKATYDKYSNQLTAYDSQTADLIEAIDAYMAIVAICEKFTSNLSSATLAKINSDSQPCVNAANDATRLEKSDFTDSFLHPYAETMIDFIGQLKVYASAQTTSQKQAADARILKAHQKLISMGNQKPQYGIMALPSTLFIDLKNAVETQRNSFIR